MKPKTLDVRRLDVAAFARRALSAAGEWAPVDFPRLADARHAAQAAPAAVRYSVRGELRRPSGGAPEPWLHLEVETVLTMTCQRCLGPLEVPLHFERWFRFVKDEDTAAQLDADSEEDVLPVPRFLDLLGLAEDELLLDLPLVPRHERCPETPRLVFEVDEAGAEDGRGDAPHPFAALAALKKGPGGAAS